MNMTSTDFLFIALGVSAFLVSIFLSITLYNVAITSRELRKLLDKADETIDKVNTYLAVPMRIVAEASSFVSNVREKYGNKEKDEEER